MDEAKKYPARHILKKLEEKRIKRKELADGIGVPYPTMSQYYGGYISMPEGVYKKALEFIDKFTL